MTLHVNLVSQAWLTRKGTDSPTAAAYAATATAIASSIAIAIVAYTSTATAFPLARHHRLNRVSVDTEACYSLIRY